VGHTDAHFHLLDWFDALPSDLHHSAPHAAPLINAINPDIVLGADIVRSYSVAPTALPSDQGRQVYDPRIVPALVATLALVLHPRVTGTGANSPTPKPKSRTAYVALTVRNAETYGAFASAARELFVCGTREASLTDVGMCAGDALAVEEVSWRGRPFLEREGLIRPEGVVRILRIYPRPE
jgi:hypothetical protein